jgi:hypothetical protein
MFDVIHAKCTGVEQINGNPTDTVHISILI